MYESAENIKKGKNEVQGVPQLQAAAHPKHGEEKETDKTSQAQTEQTYKSTKINSLFLMRVIARQRTETYNNKITQGKT